MGVINLRQREKLQMAEVLEKLKAQLCARGAKTVRGLGRAFRIMDNLDGNRKVDAGEFAVGLQEFGVECSKDEMAALSALLDKNGDGVIDFDEFLVAIRGKLNAKR